MSCRKKLKELTIKDNFMFGAVMSMEDNCRQFLELVMKLRIGEICISSEKSILFPPEYRGSVLTSMLLMTGIHIITLKCR